jgi:nitroreductase
VLLSVSVMGGAVPRLCAGENGRVETWDALTSRRNVRGYTAEPIPPDRLDRILEAARRTPSAGNRQHWDLVVVTDRGRLEELSKVWRAAGHVAGSAATIALVAPATDDSRAWEIDQYDLGQLSFAVAVAAADLGIGSGHSSVADQELARQVLGVPDGYVVAWLIALGYPADRPLAPIAEPARRPFDDVVHRERW